MKKLVLLFSVLSIFLIPSLSFADSFYSVVIEDKTTNSILRYQTEDVYYVNSNDKIYFIGPVNLYAYEDSTWKLVNTVGTQLLDNSKYNILSSNLDILVHSENIVFFSARPTPTILMSNIQELPQVVLQHGGTVLSVALTGFGLLLVVLSIPQLVKRFLSWLAH